jgi:hypothetical protein
LTAVQEWDLKKADWQHAKFPLAAEYQEGMKDRGIDISKLGMLPSSPLRFEKLAALSSGGLKDVRDGPARWPRFVSVDALNMDSSESIRRVSFAQDRSVGATQFRAQRYSDFARVVQLVSSGKHFRPTMSIFVESNLEFDDGHPFCNLLSKHGRRGTAIFLGDPSLRVAEDMYTRVINQSLATYASKGVREAFPLPEELVIWQVPDAHGGARVFPPYKAPEFTENPAERPAQVNSTAQ